MTKSQFGEIKEKRSFSAPLPPPLIFFSFFSSFFLLLFPLSFELPFFNLFVAYCSIPLPTLISPLFILLTTCEYMKKFDLQVRSPAPLSR